MTAAADMLKASSWTADEAAALLDVPAVHVERWAKLGLVKGCTFSRGAWRLPGRALFLFLSGRFEPHYRVRTAAALLDVSERSVQSWVKAGRLPVRKLGTGSAAAVLVPESSLLSLVNSQRRAAA